MPSLRRSVGATGPPRAGGARCRAGPRRRTRRRMTTEVSSGSAQVPAKPSITSGPAHPVACIQRPKRVSTGSVPCWLTAATKSAGDDPAGEDQQADPPLRDQLDQLEAVAARNRDASDTGNVVMGEGRGHRPASCGSVRARNAASSGDTTGASSRNARPAWTSCTTSSSRAYIRARTTSTSASFRAPVSSTTRIPVVSAASRMGGLRVGGEQPVVEFTVLRGQLAQRAGEDDPSGGEDGDLGAQRLEVVHAVAREHDAGSVRREAG